MRQLFHKQVFPPQCMGTSFRVITTSLLALSFFLQYPTALAEIPFFKKMAPKEVPLRLTAPDIQSSTVPANSSQSNSPQALPNRRPVSAIANESSAPGNTPKFQEGVRLYREGQYSKAYPCFEKQHQENPADLNNTYYLAITAAQLGRFKQAKAYYDEIILLDPQSKASQLAKEGRQYLPTGEMGLDPPPRFQGNINTGSVSTSPFPANSTQTPASQTQNTPSQNSSAPSNGLSAQELQALQMMMGSGNNNGMGGMGGGGNNLNSMLPYMMMNNGGGNGGAGSNTGGGLDPNFMSTMMMNQMLQNFNLDGNKNNGGE
jgi:hypothetical protein